MTVHTLKSWWHFFDAIKDGRKKHDLRKDDRVPGYAVGDVLILRRYDYVDGVYSGEELSVRVTFITGRATPCAFSSAVLMEGYVILSLEVM